MDFNPAEIHDLTMDEIAGLITPKDKEYLYRVIAENQEAFMLWQELHQALGSQQIQEAHDSMRADEPREIILADKKRIRKASLLKVVSIAAATILIITGTWVFFLSTNDKQKAGIAVDQPRHVRLQLADGQSFDLSGDSRLIRTDNMTLVNANKTLHFSTEAPLNGLSTLTVPVGKDYNIILPDGTEIHLNAVTTLTFPMRFDGNTRNITLNGEAYLKVAHDAQHPFIVELPNGSVRVLGTSFNVNTYDQEQVKVSLLDGAVSVKAGRDSALLKPGYEIISTRHSMSQARPFDPEQVLSWRNGFYEYWESPLKEVCLTLARWYGVEVVMDNRAVGEKTFTGAIDRDRPLDEFLVNLKSSDSGLHYYFDEKGVLHFK